MFLLIPLLSIPFVQSLLNPFFNHWHCVGIQEKINFNKPYSFCVGDLELVLWKNNPSLDTFSTTLNICKHMGSRLDNAQITKKGCLKCPYHGLEYNAENPRDVIGKTVLHEGKIFWSYQPTQEKPYSIPFFNSPQYATSFLEMEMPCSLQDSAYNTMDLLHPEFVHNNLFGFGSTIPPRNVQFYNYDNYTHRSPSIGLSFDYYSKSFVTRGFTHTDNFHLFVYPSFTWSRVSFPKMIMPNACAASLKAPKDSKFRFKTSDKNHLIISVNFLPTGVKQTKWFVTICHNFYKNPFEKRFLQLMALSILTQDYCQMKNQAVETDLKQAVLFGKKFENEDPVLWLNRYFTEQYKYVDMTDCVELYEDFLRK